MNLVHNARPQRRLAPYISRRSLTCFGNSLRAIVGPLKIRTPSITSRREDRLVHVNHVQSRQMSWLGRLLRTRRDSEAFAAVSDGQDEAARSAILEKVMKGRQPSDLMLRCTILNSQGDVKTISGQFKRQELCLEHKLNPRDLRKIDSRIPNLVPTIFARKEAILINILHIRALVKADTVVLFDTYGSADSRLHSIFVYHLEHNLKAKGTGLPYEFRALESILLSVLSALEAEMVFMRNLIGGILAELEDDIDRDKFKRLLHYSRRLTAFQNRAKLVQEALEEVLEQDEDLAAMYLTDKKNNHPRSADDHEDLEVLLESFSKQVEEIVNEADTISSNVQSTQEIVELILDSNRNALLALDLKVSIGTLGIGTGALIAGLFGMNLQSHLEESHWAFVGMSAFATSVSLLIAWLGLRRLAKIRKVGLSSSANGRRSINRRPWLPLPLRKRGLDDWT
ncbi:cora-domain-containing protein [Fomitiporia mediterranea MF3/22]|uniref:cora-domain-containing protein n=1 Tax=Fomitiporia mediterranea (strain MF3/22) TaxID=694068 RepID=UPI00044092BC|nr:cora-domain-containing protein [Fomitiporia mediterranea MF3/22]EJD05505.1 cora-domain-containing protein [Fomitiporia mediterranea MF3/22]